MEGQPKEITMERQAAMQLLNTLAQGIDPHSGESFPADSPYQHPDTVRAQQLQNLGLTAGQFLHGQASFG